MSAIRQLLSDSLKRSEVDEFLSHEIGRAGYGGVEMTKTPLGTRLTIYAIRPSLVVGRGGEFIRNLARTLEEKHSLFNPQIAVAEVPIPELNPFIVGSKITHALGRGIHFRRACQWAVTSVMNSGALGVEIVISGKITSARARREKFRNGYIPRVGDSAAKNLSRAVVHTQLKPGLVGVRVTIVPPTYVSPDKISIKTEAPPVAASPEGQPEAREPVVEDKKVESPPPSQPSGEGQAQVETATPTEVASEDTEPSGETQATTAAEGKNS